MWNDRADFQQAMTTPTWQRVVEDGRHVFDMDWLWNMSAHLEEVPMIDRPTSPLWGAVLNENIVVPPPLAGP